MAAKIDHFEVDLLSEIGKGSYGIVYMCKDIRNNQELAVKKIKYIIKTKEDVKLKQSISTEISIIEKLKSHPNIIRYFHHKDDGESFWLFMEFCQHGDLASYLQSSTNVSLNNKTDIMVQCASALLFLHSKDPPVVHRDIKPENILIKCENNRTIAKLCDFGAGKIYDRSMSSLAGTQAYMAPELFVTETDEMKYHPEIDVFSLGLLFKVLLQYEQGRDDHQFVPVSAASKQFIYYGLEMELAGKENKPFPKLFEENAANTSGEIEIQEIIENMTRYKNEERMKLNDVKRHLMNIHCRMILDKLAGISTSNQITKNEGIEDIHTRLVELDTMRNLFENNEKEYEDKQQDFIQTQLSNEKLKGELENALMNNEMLQKKLDNVVQQKDNHEREVLIVQESKAHLEKDLEELQTSRDNLITELDLTRKCRDSLQLQLNNALTKIEDLESEMRKLMTSKEALDLELRESVASNESLQNKLTSVLVSREKLQKDMEALISNHSKDTLLNDDSIGSATEWQSNMKQHITQQTMALDELSRYEEVGEAHANFWQKFDEKWGENKDKFRQTYDASIKPRSKRGDDSLLSSINTESTYNNTNSNKSDMGPRTRSKTSVTDSRTGRLSPRDIPKQHHVLKQQRSRSDTETSFGNSSSSNLSDDFKTMSASDQPLATGTRYNMYEPDYVQTKSEVDQTVLLNEIPIIIDGVNVALCHGNHISSSLKGIELALKYFIEEEFKHIHVLLQTGMKIHEDFIAYVKYPEHYARSLLEFADTENGIIITNDILSSKLYPQWKGVIKNQVKGYAFNKDEFIPRLRTNTAFDSL